MLSKAARWFTPPAPPPEAAPPEKVFAAHIALGPPVSLTPETSPSASLINPAAWLNRCQYSPLEQGGGNGYLHSHASKTVLLSGKGRRANEWLFRPGSDIAHDTAIFFVEGTMQLERTLPNTGFFAVRETLAGDKSGFVGGSGAPASEARECPDMVRLLQADK